MSQFFIESTECQLTFIKHPVYPVNCILTVGFTRGRYLSGCLVLSPATDAAAISLPGQEVYGATNYFFITSHVS